ncbi:winged helix-turn-helix transcriptional regulator [Qingshengfaniella alkalisoli]|uniref:OmpR/PhoB-type domain-containing protein n=1 Tax=Qingshengfaniella alkalisoli TaxID=2599296 RepID=A0A5B8IAG3_9RHOB|nr:winged helix-turn-helix domain-containing protein [Qingshengfaniella alkalisoli]QDY71475.1 hypothetical protein FPZ52_17510 [Qingshengfaniella alkalisoli]
MHETPFTETPARLLVVDATDRMAALMRNAHRWGFESYSARSTDLALTAIRCDRPAIIGVNGTVPVPVENASRRRKIPVTTIDEADSDPSEALRHLRAVLRRERPGVLTGGSAHGFLSLDNGAMRAEILGNPVPLGVSEFCLLGAMLDDPDRVWSREHLLQRVWGEGATHEPRTVDAYVARLRRALVQHGNPDPITTVRGKGYRLT